MSIPFFNLPTILDIPAFPSFLAVFPFFCFLTFFLVNNICLPFPLHKAFTSLFFPSSTFTAFSSHFQASICKPFPHCPCLPLSFFPFTPISAFLFYPTKHLHLFFSLPLPSQPFLTLPSLYLQPFPHCPCLFHFPPTTISAFLFYPTKHLHLSFFLSFTFLSFSSHSQASICNPFLIAHASFIFSLHLNLCLLFYPLKAFTSLFSFPSTFTAFSSSLYLQPFPHCPCLFHFPLPLNLCLLFYSYKIHHFISLFFFTVYTTLTTLISASLAYLTASIE